MTKKTILILFIFGVVFLLSACKDDETTIPGSGMSSGFRFSTTAFEDGAVIPVKYSCDGSNLCPKLEWSGMPEGTKSFAIIIDDPDAVPVAGYVWDHWLICNIPSSVTSIAEGSTALNIGALGGISLKNSFGNFNYGGPYPPPDQNHKYEFEIYALDVTQLPGVNSSSSKVHLESTLSAHTLEKVVFTGTFEH